MATPTATVRPSDGTAWTRLDLPGPSPGARRDASLVALNDRGGLLLFGGQRAGAPLDDLWSFDPATSRWSEINVSGPRPAARSLAAAVYDLKRKRLVVAGGLTRLGYLNDIWAYDVALGNWRQLARNSVGPSARAGACAVFEAAGDRILVIAGANAVTRFDDVWSYDPLADEWEDLSPPIGRPPRRTAAGCGTPAPGRVMVFGGAGDAPLTDLWSFAVSSRQWAPLVPAAVARAYFGMVFDPSARRFVVFLGLGTAGPLNDVWALSAEGTDWRKLLPATAGPSARSGSSVALLEVQKRVYLFGGADPTDQGDLWAFDLK